MIFMTGEEQNFLNEHLSILFLLTALINAD